MEGRRGGCGRKEGRLRKEGGEEEGGCGRKKGRKGLWKEGGEVVEGRRGGVEAVEGRPSGSNGA